MEKFADCIPEFPRRSPGIFTLHDKLFSMKARLEEYGRRLRRLPSKVETWEGSARDAFDCALAGEVRQTGRLNEGLDEGARAIRTFAYAAENAERKIDAARAGMRALDRQVDAIPDEERDEKMEELKTKAQSIAKDAKAAIDSLHKAGDVCAAELRAALRLEAVKSNGKGDNIGELHKLNDDDIHRINDELKHMDFREVSQGEIGDCYLVATLMAMMRTPEGRKLLQKSIRPHTVNGHQDGYLVTVYEDPDHPERTRTVFVERTYLRGANGGSPGVVSILEAAYGQMYEGGTRGNSVFGPTGISAGEPSAVMEEITGKDTTIIKKGTWGFGDGYNDDQRKDIQQALKNHRPVVANTVTRIVGFQNSKFIKEVSVHGEKYRIQMMRNHSYVVVAADKDGVTVRNPWGGSRKVGDKYIDPEYAEFKMSWDDFGASFGNVHVGGGYPK